MPVSFWYFLVVSIIAFVPAISDHGEAWRILKEAPKGKKLWPGIKFAVLWGIPILSLIGTIYLGRESLQDDQDSQERDRQITTLSNRVVTVESEYKNATNDLTAANKKLKQLTTDRTITDAQEKQIDQMLLTCPRQPIWVVIGPASGENLRFAKRVREILDSAGFKTSLYDESHLLPLTGQSSDNGIVTLYSANDLDVPVPTDIEIWDSVDSSNVGTLLSAAFSFLSPITVGHMYLKGLQVGQVFVFVSTKSLQ